MFEHWLCCYKLFEGDRKYLRNVYELTYETYLENPAKYHHEIAAFIGTRVPEPPSSDKFYYVLQWRNPPLRVPEQTMEEVSAAHNKKYLDRWRNLLENSFFKGYYRYVARKYEERFAKYGYSLTEGFDASEEVLQRSGKISTAIGTFYCHAADAGAFSRRLWTWVAWYAKQLIKATLPNFLLTRIRNARREASLRKGGADVVSS
jgi:hypothetical protein